MNGNRIARLEDEHEVRYGIIPGRQVAEKLVIADATLRQNPIEHPYNFVSDMGHFISTWLQRSRNQRSQHQDGSNDV